MEIHIGYGKDIKFGYDPWKTQVPFCTTHKKAYKAVVKKDAKLTDLVQHENWSLQLSVTPDDETKTEFKNLISLIGPLLLL